MKQIGIMVLAFFLIGSACSSKKSTTAGSGSKKPTLSKDKSYFVMTRISDDSTYGYTERNPVRVGYNGFSNGPENERKYLRGLAGPKGQMLSFSRIGSCCPFENKKLDMGGGMLDKYRIKWSGLEEEEEKVIYIDMYQYEDAKIPVGFTARKY